MKASTDSLISRAFVTSLTSCTRYRGNHSSHDILALANASAEGIEKKPDFGCSGTEPIY